MRLIIFGLVAIAATVTVTAAPGLDLVLLHINDIHSQFEEMNENCNECLGQDAVHDKCFGGLPRVAEFVRTEKLKAAKNGVHSLFVMAGDTFQGTAYFSFFKWKPCVDFVKELKPDIMTLGNHEFDNGVSDVVSFLKELQDIPTVVSNLNMSAEPELNKLVLPSYVFMFNNTKVGVVGYLSTTCPDVAKTEEIVFFDEIESLKKETKRLRDNGVNIIIGLGHSGVDIDEIVAREVEDIDIIVSGHSHTFLYSGTPPSIEVPYGPYPLYVTNDKTKKSIPIIQAYANTKYIGKVNMRFDVNGELIDINGSPILLDRKIKQDSSMLKVLNKWKPLVNAITNITIGHTAVQLKNVCHFQECNIGNIITDSFIYDNVMRTKNCNKIWTDAPIALVLCGGIRMSINDVGNITLKQIMSVSPFVNKIAKVTVSGTTLLEAFERSVFFYTELNGGKHFLQVSGVKVEYDLSRNPGNRVSSLFLRCGNCAVPIFEPLVLTNNYTVLMNRFLANGGDGYTVFQNRVKEIELIDIEDYNAIMAYTKVISPITTGIEGRIVFKINNNGKSKASNIKNNSWNSRFVFIGFYTTIVLILKNDLFGLTQVLGIY
ncbi:Hypothetical protein CINCED_3A000690 [Cinara cedri]|uniref:5'-nucleotidase n=1 Tax=Cinara cedri TaxID=506608 RepID=A0A5E4M8G0_9HEMI|nr:Hypothetical protein CINCED_3A000690 [Cinara cedri]